MDWQIHVYGAASPVLSAEAGRAGIPLHQVHWSDAADEAGLARDALYLVRPDGYVALADPDQDVDAFRALLAKFEIAPRLGTAA